MLGAWGSLRACQPLLRHCAASQARAPGCVTAQRASGACRTLATAMQLQQAEGGPSEPAAGARRRVSRHGNASLPPPPMDFKRAASFDDLLQANVRFLRGELQETPYCHAPTDPETAPLLPLLERLHLQGRVFTFESQPGLRSVRWRAPWASACGSRAGGGVYEEVHQRAYVDCWVEAAALPALLDRLRARRDLWHFVDVPGRPQAFQHNVGPAATWRGGDGVARLTLTRWRSAPGRGAELRAEPWNLHTNAVLAPGWADEELRMLSGGNPGLRPVLRRCVLVAVMARRYGPCPAVLDVLLGEP